MDAFAQVQLDTLAPANTYDAGTLTVRQGAMSPDLWQGTNAQTAISLIQNLPNSPSQSSKHLIRGVLLSGGVPPHSGGGLERENYVTERLWAILNLEDSTAYETISNQSSLDFTSATTVKLTLTHALMTGDTAKACQIADTIKLERKSPYWAKLRSYCHYTRDEIPAAELTADLLKRAGHDDEMFFNLLGNLTGSQVKIPKLSALQSPLHIAMAQNLVAQKSFKGLTQQEIAGASPRLARTVALNKTLPPELRFHAFLRSAHILTLKQIAEIFAGDIQSPQETTETIKANDIWMLAQWGEMLNTIKTSTDITRTSPLVADFLSQAETNGIFRPMSILVAQDIVLIPPALQAQSGPQLFARIAVQNRDLSTLRGLYMALVDDNPLRGRLALASDALGGGFLGSSIGTDIETRLRADTPQKTRAVRDVYLAFALGAYLPQGSVKPLALPVSLEGQAMNAGGLLMLKDASRRRAQAETALIAAQIIGSNSLSTFRPDDVASLLSALNDAGLGQISAEFAAIDFLALDIVDE
ncbi:MAG: hypothetical protein JKX72_07175 [Robiginitomaculum sp.]|nr:hypothetical protein [Robiginitomaculum sp.]